jgi:hypothetical protein
MASSSAFQVGFILYRSPPKATPGTNECFARKNGTVLRGDADLDAPTEAANRVGSSRLNARPLGAATAAGLRIGNTCPLGQLTVTWARSNMTV